MGLRKGGVELGGRNLLMTLDNCLLVRGDGKKLAMNKVLTPWLGNMVW